MTDEASRTQKDCLQPGHFVDSDHPRVIEYARAHARTGTDSRQTVLDLYYAVRDGIRYDPYQPMDDPTTYRASDAVIKERGFCVPKAALLAACCRVVGIPARPGYADVRNHLATPRLIEMMGTDIFYWHSYCETLIDGTWVSCGLGVWRELVQRIVAAGRTRQRQCLSAAPVYLGCRALSSRRQSGEPSGASCCQRRNSSRKKR